MHPDNPCQYADSEAIAAKTWELLRRNERFKKDARQYMRMCQGKNKPGLRWRDAAWRFIIGLSGTEELCHPFAAAAFRWIIPEPDFTRRLPKRVGGTDKDGKAVQWDLVWRGFAPEMPPASDAGWQVDDRTKPSRRSRVVRLGPELHWTDGDKVDEIVEWGDYQKSLPQNGTPLIDRPWREIPKPLQRAFQNSWQTILLRQANPVTGQRDWSRPGIVPFIHRNWIREAMHAERRDLLPVAIQLQDLSDKYIVFAFPKGKHISKNEIRDALKQWEKEIEKKNTVVHGNVFPHKFGAETDWEAFLFAEALRARGKDVTDQVAAARFVEEHHVKPALEKLRRECSTLSAKDSRNTYRESSPSVRQEVHKSKDWQAAQNMNRIRAFIGVVYPKFEL